MAGKLRRMEISKTWSQQEKALQGLARGSADQQQERKAGGEREHARFGDR